MLTDGSVASGSEPRDSLITSLKVAVSVVYVWVHVVKQDLVVFVEAVQDDGLVHIGLVFFFFW